MKKTEFELLQPGDKIVVGTRPAFNNGRHGDLTITSVIAKGHFSRIQGQCGPMIIENEGAPETVCVFWNQGRVYSYKTNSYQNPIVPILLSAGRILMALAEYQPILDAIQADTAKHQAIQKAYQDEHDSLKRVIEDYYKVGEKGGVSIRRGYREQDVDTLEVSINLADALEFLPKKVSVALDKLHNLKAPTC